MRCSASAVCFSVSQRIRGVPARLWRCARGSFVALRPRRACGAARGADECRWRSLLSFSATRLFGLNAVFWQECDNYTRSECRRFFRGLKRPDQKGGYFALCRTSSVNAGFCRLSVSCRRILRDYWHFLQKAWLHHSRRSRHPCDCGAPSGYGAFDGYSAPSSYSAPGSCDPFDGYSVPDRTRLSRRLRRLRRPHRPRPLRRFR